MGTGALGGTGRDAAVTRAAETLASGGMVLLLDDLSADSGGSLLFAAESANPRNVAFAVRCTTGILGAPMSPRRARWLELPAVLVEGDAEPQPFLLPVDSVRAQPGVSASGRAATLRALADPLTGVHDLRRPGHVFPLRSHEGGVLERAGRTEAAVDLLEIAGCEPVGVIAEVVARDGSLMRIEDLHRFASARALPVLTIADVCRHRLVHEQLLTATV